MNENEWHHLIRQCIISIPTTEIFIEVVFGLNNFFFKLAKTSTGKLRTPWPPCRWSCLQTVSRRHIIALIRFHSFTVGNLMIIEQSCKPIVRRLL
jgi:hypothetical protein